jgi:hypothetical protein
MSSLNCRGERLAPLLLIACGGLGGCASFTGGTEPIQVVHVRSVPAGAAVSIDGRPTGITPVEVPLDRHAQHDLRLTLNGYRPYEGRLRPGLRPAFFGNLLLLGGAPVGMVLDAASGGWRGFDKQITIELVPDVP